MSVHRSRGIPRSEWVRLSEFFYFTPLRFLPQRNSAAFALSPDKDTFQAASASTHGASMLERSRTSLTHLSASASNNAHFFNIDHLITYSSFNADFGPASLGVFIRVFHEIEREMAAHQQQQHQQNTHAPLVVCCGSSVYTAHNAACIVAAFGVVVLEQSPAAVKAAFAKLSSKLLPFRDAGVGPSTFDSGLEDIVDAFVLARRHRWLPPDWRAFALEAYERVEEMFDAHVIVPGLFVALSTPDTGRDGASISRLLPLFSALNVRLVIRLSDPPLYSDVEFQRNGISTAKMPFADGAVPTDAHIREFMDSCNTVFDNFACGPEVDEPKMTDAQIRKARSDALLFKNNNNYNITGSSNSGKTAGGEQISKKNKKKKIRGMVAVHCNAGLGRTGTMIALALMHRYADARAREVISWIRLCRPGSILGRQPHFLLTCESRLMQSRITLTPPSNLLKKVAGRVCQPIVVPPPPVDDDGNGDDASDDATAMVANAVMLAPRAATGSLRLTTSSSNQLSQQRSSHDEETAAAGPLPELRAQSSLSFTSNTIATAATARATLPATKRRSATKTNNNSSSSGKMITGADCFHRTGTAALSSSSMAPTPISSAVQQARLEGCRTAPFSSFRVPWSSPLVPTVYNETKAQAYRDLSRSAFNVRSVANRGFVTRVYGRAAAAAAAEAEVRELEQLSNVDSVGEAPAAAGLTGLLADQRRARKMFSPVPLSL